MVPPEGRLTNLVMDPARAEASGESRTAEHRGRQGASLPTFNAHKILSTRMRLHQAISHLLDGASVRAGGIALIRHRRTARVLPCKLKVGGLHELEYTPSGASCWTTEQVSLELELPAGRVLRRIEIDVIGIGIAGRTATVSVSDTVVWERRLDDSGRIIIRTPRIRGATDVRVTLSIPPFIPREHGGPSTDDRRLGLAAREICLLLDDTLPRRLWSLLKNVFRRTKR